MIICRKLASSNHIANNTKKTMYIIQIGEPTTIVKDCIYIYNIFTSKMRYLGTN